MFNEQMLVERGGTKVEYLCIVHPQRVQLQMTQIQPPTIHIYCNSQINTLQLFKLMIIITCS